MSKYRKKPVIVEAMQLRWDNWSEMCEFAGVGKLIDGKPEGCFIDSDGNPTTDNAHSDNIGLLTPTLEGIAIARENDWIIKEGKGEIYLCKPDIFKMTYEKVE